MGIDRCFRPSQVNYLSLNAKDDLHDHMMPLLMGHDKLIKAPRERSSRIISSDEDKTYVIQAKPSWH
jgi:hypothetical protein